jgi:hypothetical protein
MKIAMPNTEHIRAFFRKIFVSDRTRFALNLVWLLVVLGLAIWIEVPHVMRPPRGKCASGAQTETEVSASTYSSLVSGGYIGVRSRRVTIVPLEEGEEPDKVLNNVCEQRWYVAKLVRRLSDAAAAVIVIDKTFAPDSCDEGDAGTLALISAVQGSGRPIVAAVSTHLLSEDPKGACLVLGPSLDFGRKRSSNGTPSDEAAVYLGSSRLNVDFRKVPIFWNVYGSEEAFKKGAEPNEDVVETLPYLAATLADPGLKQERRLNDIRSNGEHPFTGFINPDALSRLNALDFLCAGPDRDEIEARYSIKCAASKGVGQVAGGQVFVIGEDVPGKDRHELFGNDVPGMYLQANYIESLLEGRYLRRLGAGWDIAMLVLWVAVLYLLFWLLRPELALLICVALGAAIWFGITQLVMWEGMYPEVWLTRLGLIALVLKYADARGHLLVEPIREAIAKRSARTSER